MTFPSKVMDRINEMNRLYVRTRSSESDTISPPFFQSVMMNKSSSSAESTSPETYEHYRPSSSATRHKITLEDSRYYNPDLLEPFKHFSHSSATQHQITLKDAPYYDPDLLEPFKLHEPLQVNPNLFEDVFSGRKRRAIVGRKIFENTPCKPETKLDFNWCMEDLSHSPPGNSKNYELFPTEIKINQPELPSSRNWSDFSTTRNHFSTPIAPMKPPQRWMHKNSPPNHPFTPYNSHYTNYNAAGSSKSEIGPPKACTFCRKNGETPIVYMTHSVKEKVGDKQVVTCPILRSHVCNTCGASGDNAHTITYCPLLRSQNNGQPLKSTTITLKNTRIKSNGRRRY